MAPAKASHYHYATPHGAITIETKGSNVIFVSLGAVDLASEYAPSSVGNRAATEILEFLSGKRRWFSVAFKQDGSEFQKLVWKEVCRIPYGQHRTAAQIADAIGHSGSHKAVGSALRASRLMMLVPTHRVTNAAGKPWGTGKDARIRAAILKIEEDTITKRTLV